MNFKVKAKEIRCLWKHNKREPLELSKWGDFTRLKDLEYQLPFSPNVQLPKHHFHEAIFSPYSQIHPSCSLHPLLYRVLRHSFVLRVVVTNVHPQLELSCSMSPCSDRELWLLGDRSRTSCYIVWSSIHSSEETSTYVNQWEFLLLLLPLLLKEDQLREWVSYYQKRRNQSNKSTLHRRSLGCFLVAESVLSGSFRILLQFN